MRGFAPRIAAGRSDHERVDPFDGFGELARIRAAGLREIRTATAAAADESESPVGTSAEMAPSAGKGMRAKRGLAPSAGASFAVTPRSSPSASHAAETQASLRSLFDAPMRAKSLVDVIGAMPTKATIAPTSAPPK